MIFRRQFIALLLSLPLFAACRGAEKKPLARIVELGDINRFLEPITHLSVFRLLIKNVGTLQKPRLKAMSLVCTHQECGLSYRKESEVIQCPCHGAQFALDGQVLVGPATEPLKWHSLQLKGHKLLVDLDSKVSEKVELLPFGS